MRNVALIMILVSAQAIAGQEGDASASLYERLGGWDNVERIVHDTIALHRENPKIARHFADVDIEALQKHVTAFFAGGTGGPNTYAGRDMASTHAGMGLSDPDFNAAVADVLAARLLRNSTMTTTRWRSQRPATDWNRTAAVRRHRRLARLLRTGTIQRHRPPARRYDAPSSSPP